MNLEQLACTALVAAIFVALWLVMDHMIRRQLAADMREAEHNRSVAVASGERLVLDAGGRPVVDEGTWGVPL